MKTRSRGFAAILHSPAHLRVIWGAALCMLGLLTLWIGSSSRIGLVKQWFGDRCIDMKSQVVEAYFDPVACVTREERRERIIALVKAVDRLLTQLDIDYWLDSGTLLGQFREQNVMLWDNDADIGITAAGYEKLRGLKAPVDVPEGFEFQVYDSELYDTDDRDANIPIRLVDTRFGFYVDGFVFQEAVVNDVEVLSTAASLSWHTCVKCLRVGTYEALFVIPKAYVFPLIACDFTDFRVVCPARRTLYLEHLYGSDFRTPKPRH